MTDIERVQQMVHDGRITAEEGDRLIAVLSDAKAADQELQLAGQQMEAAAQAAESAVTPQPPAAPLPPVNVVEPTPPPPPPAAPRASSAATSMAAPSGSRWVKIEMLAGDLDVTVDDSLDSPEVESDGPGGVVIETTDDGYRVSWDQAGGNFLDKMLGKLRTGDINLRLPPGHGIDLAATAGDVDLKGVPYLRGYLTAGDLDATGLKGIDFTSRAGDIAVDLTLTEGAHSLTVTAGNVKVRLDPASSVTIKGDVSIGDATSNVPGVKTNGRSLGAGLQGSYGAGAASLNLHVTTGNLELKVDRG